MFMPLDIAVMLFIKQTHQSEVASIPFSLLSASKEDDAKNSPVT